ncbi:MAG: CPBP family intramembrane metalloprotease [Butyrivibrio sp.]|uniref:CPBP family intramembrane glutamic endopeptidase n=1 Tax=Butyrivibrio sp. TaxID=28121 RepID=UPI0025EBCC96|nr:type II CAAX endopeptidase family protein [Butyrivibrio sp.]MCR5771461.1 CPBP family intramembrane metalloprotease [Butyrivibrio sp.]
MVKTDNRISAAKAYSCLGLSFLVIEFIIAFLGKLVVTKLLGCEELTDNWRIIYEFVLDFLFVLPLNYAVLRKLPKFKIDQKRLGIKNFLTCACVAFSLEILANIFTIALMYTANMVTGIQTGNPLVDRLSSMSLFSHILIVCIIAPIYEELMFRKILLDRVAHYGEVTAMLLSGVMFGLAHGNIYQFFYTALGGCFYAFVYLRTGKIKYTIFLHMLNNSFSTIIWGIRLLLNGGNITVAYACTMAFGVLAIVITILGIVLMVRNKDKFVFEHHKEEFDVGYRFTTLIVNAGMMVYLLFWIGQTVLTLFGTSFTQLLISAIGCGLQGLLK